MCGHDASCDGSAHGEDVSAGRAPRNKVGPRHPRRTTRVSGAAATTTCTHARHIRLQALKFCAFMSGMFCEGTVGADPPTWAHVCEEACLFRQQLAHTRRTQRWPLTRKYAHPHAHMYTNTHTRTHSITLTRLPLAPTFLHHNNTHAHMHTGTLAVHTAWARPPSHPATTPRCGVWCQHRLRPPPHTPQLLPAHTHTRTHT